MTIQDLRKAVDDAQADLEQAWTELRRKADADPFAANNSEQVSRSTVILMKAKIALADAVLAQPDIVEQTFTFNEFLSRAWKLMHKMPFGDDPPSAHAVLFAIQELVVSRDMEDNGIIHVDSKPTWIDDK